MNTRLSFSLPKEARLRTRRDYQRLNREFKRHIGEWIIIDARLPNGAIGKSPRLGITASKRFGKSHHRNRFKRIVREAFRLCQHQLPKDIELNVKPRSCATGATSTQILEEMVRLLPHE